MNSEIKRLQQEINKLRKQNLEKQRQVKYIPLNIISNNLYINNPMNNKSQIQKKYNNNSRYNSFINKKGNINKSSLSLNFKNKKNNSYGKLPFKKGMFSYKNSLITSTPNNNYKNINNYNMSNKINYKYNIYNNNTSLLSANLKLNLDNDDNDNNISQNQNIILHGRVPSSSSLDLSKYKISDNSLISHNKSNKKLISPNISQKNSYKNVSSFTNNNINNINNSSIFQKKNYYNKNNNNNIIINNISNNKINQNNSMDNVRISPIIPKKINSNEQVSPPLLIIDDYKENNNYTNDNSNKNNNKKRKPFDHFRNSNKNEKESRRLIIEYIKVLNRQNKNNLGRGDINMIMSKNNISRKVLNQEIIAKEFNSSNIFNNSTIINSNNNINNDISLKPSLNNSLINFHNSVMNVNNKVLSKNFQSPIKNNIKDFLTNMNDEKKDKINMVKFLSTPKIMNINFLHKKYKYICFICPNNISYINGIESYIFKFLDIKSHKLMGGFDLIKISSCSINNKKQNNFFIETYDGKTHRNYEFETNSKENALYYIKSINYLSQLEKCKIYNNKSIFQ